MKLAIATCLVALLAGASAVQGSVLSDLQARNTFLANSLNSGNVTAAVSTMMGKVNFMTTGMKNPLMGSSNVAIYLKSVLGVHNTLAVLGAGTMHQATGPGDGTVAYAWGTYTTTDPTTGKVLSTGFFVQTAVQEYGASMTDWFFNNFFSAESAQAAFAGADLPKVHVPAAGYPLRAPPSLGVNPVYGALQSRYAALADAFNSNNATQAADVYHVGGRVLASGAPPAVGRSQIAAGIQMFFNNGLERSVFGIMGAGHSTSDPMVFSRTEYLFAWPNGKTGSGFLFHVWEFNPTSGVYEILFELVDQTDIEMPSN